MLFGDSESENSWLKFFTWLKKRSLERHWLGSFRRPQGACKRHHDSLPRSELAAVSMRLSATLFKRLVLGPCSANHPGKKEVELAELTKGIH